MSRKYYKCLYTNQKTQKHKRWQEGSCKIEFNDKIKKIHLYNDSRKHIETYVFPMSDDNEIPQEYTLRTHLVQLCDDDECDETNQSQIQGAEMHLEIENATSRNKRRIVNNSVNKVDGYKRVKETDEKEPNDIHEWEGSRRRNENKGIVNTIHNKIFGKNIKVGISGHGEGNQTFHTPRGLQNTSINDKEDTKCKRSKQKASIEKKYQNQRTSYMEEETDRLIPVTYTQNTQFQKKKVKWLDGFVTLDNSNKNTLVTLYNELEQKIASAKMMLPTPQEEEYLHVGYYVIYNDFYKNEYQEEPSNKLSIVTAHQLPVIQYKKPDPYVSPNKLLKPEGRNGECKNNFEYRDLSQNRNHPHKNFSNPSITNKNKRNYYLDSSVHGYNRDRLLLDENQDMNQTPRRHDLIHVQPREHKEDAIPIYKNGSTEFVLFYEKKHMYSENDSLTESTDPCEEIISIGKFVCQNNFDYLKNFITPFSVPLLSEEETNLETQNQETEESIDEKQEPKTNRGNPKKTICDYFNISVKKKTENGIQKSAVDKGCILKSEMNKENMKSTMMKESDIEKEINHSLVKDAIIEK